MRFEETLGLKKLKNFHFILFGGGGDKITYESGGAKDYP